MSNDGLVYYLIFNKSKKQSRMDISETLVTLDTQDTTQKTEKMSITGPSKNRGELMVLAKCKQFLLLIGTRHVIHKKIHCIDG